MVRIHPDPPTHAGAVAQLGEHLLCKQGVVGSIPSSSTNVREAGPQLRRQHWKLQASGTRPLPLVFRIALSVVL
jgi:hypothetical protein